jgi:glycerate kinase
MSLRVLIAPSGFKESLEPEAVADCIAAGMMQAAPGIEILKVPLVDGGEGFTNTLVKATGGKVYEVDVVGPVGEKVLAHYGALDVADPKTVALEMASAAGLRYVPKEARDPLRTTTFGVGELIRAALDSGAERFLIGCGDSGTNDAGAGMAQALGTRLLDSHGHEIGWGGIELLKLASIDNDGLDPRLRELQIDVACNTCNLLCGPQGVARIYGPQKGATLKDVEKLEQALDHFAEVVERDLGIDVRTLPGSGASGGLGAGLHAFLGARILPYFQIVSEFIEFEEHLKDVDLVITAEGMIDYKTALGKIPVEVSKRAKAHELPVVVLVGSIGENANVNYKHGIDAFISILEVPSTLDHAVASTTELLTRAAERLTRVILVGRGLAS